MLVLSNELYHRFFETSVRSNAINPRFAVVTSITHADYKRMLSEFELREEGDVYRACGALSQSGGYFQAVWSLNAP